MEPLGKLLESAGSYKTYWVCYLLGLAGGLLLTPVVSYLARYVGALDRPRHRKAHRAPTPLLGGLAIFAAMWLPLALLSFFWSNEITRQMAGGGWQRLILIFSAGLVMLLTGVVDDKWGLNARWKFVVQIPVAIALMLMGVSFSVVHVPFWGNVELGFMGPVLSVLWLVGVTNALNLIDGIDGLAAGVAFFVSGTNAIIALLNGNTLLALMMWSMAGACLGFLRYNFSPARIFLGDTGSLFLGMTLAVTGIQANVKGSLATSMFIPVLVLGYPVLDTLLAMARRVVRGRPLFTGDGEHIHHHLLARGLDHRRVALVLYAVCGLFCAVGLASVMGSDVWVGVGLAVIATLFGVGLWALGYMKYFTRQALGERPLFRIAFHLAEVTKERMKLARRREEVFHLVREACIQFGMQRLEISLPEGSWGGAHQAQWTFDGEEGDQAGDREEAATDTHPRSDANGLAVAATQEQYNFQDTGLSVVVVFSGAGVTPELLMEYRTLLEDVLGAANRRLRELAALASGTMASSTVASSSSAEAAHTG